MLYVLIEILKPIISPYNNGLFQCRSMPLRATRNNNNSSSPSVYLPYTFLFRQVSPKKLYWFCMGRFGAKIRINDVVRKVENAQRKSQNYCLLSNVILYHEYRVESIVVCNKQLNIVTKAHIQFSCKPYKFGFQDLSFIRWQLLVVSTID